VGGLDSDETQNHYGDRRSGNKNILKTKTQVVLWEGRQEKSESCLNNNNSGGF